MLTPSGNLSRAYIRPLEPISGVDRGFSLADVLANVPQPFIL